jgi:hypothetical protein
MGSMDGCELPQNEDFVDDDELSEKETSPLQESCTPRLSDVESYDQYANDQYVTTGSGARRRLSIFLLGDMDPDEAEDDEPLFLMTMPHVTRQRKPPSRLRSCSSDSPNSSALVLTTMPNDSVLVSRGNVAAEPADSQMAPLRVRSIDRAVGIVLRAKQFKSRVRSSAIVPYKPDTPVPLTLKPESNIQRSPVKEPIRFVYEGLLPYVRYSSLQLKPSMNHLRVPGRQPPNVPQTIMEEDTTLSTPPTSPSPCNRDDTLSSFLANARKRKNASSWIAPPVIDVMEAPDANHSKNMRVECPGVLVEHHS